MKRIIFRYWLMNIFIGVALFIIYRIVIADTNHEDGNFLEQVLQILDVLLNVTYSFIYLIAIVFCSLTLFLNLIDKIRNNFYLSLLTFLGIPLFCVIFIIINTLTESLLYTGSVTVFRNFLIFSIIYLLCTTLEFLLFRKRINKIVEIRDDYSEKSLPIN